jgi:peptidoglycan hydrolase-like protein with peptidoglycan-binding domain
MKNMKINKSWNLKIAVMLAAVMFGWGAQNAFAAGAVTAQAGIGSSGVNVSNLQSFLASNPMIYPQGLVTGYFGQLTANAVSAFQAAFDLPVVGRVGPLTLSAINRVMVMGRGLDISGPDMSGLIARLSSRQVTINWTTNEAATAKVFYDTRPISTREASLGFTEPTISSAYVTVSSVLTNSQGITIQNLVPGTQYYYIAESVDASGNVSVSSQSTFTAI